MQVIYSFCAAPVPNDPTDRYRSAGRGLGTSVLQDVWKKSAEVAHRCVGHGGYGWGGARVCKERHWGPFPIIQIHSNRNVREIASLPLRTTTEVTSTTTAKANIAHGDSDIPIPTSPKVIKPSKREKCDIREIIQKLSCSVLALLSTWLHTETPVRTFAHANMGMCTYRSPK